MKYKINFKYNQGWQIAFMENYVDSSSVEFIVCVAGAISHQMSSSSFSDKTLVSRIIIDKIDEFGNESHMAELDPKVVFNL
jgi:hypothetical protein